MKWILFLGAAYMGLNYFRNQQLLAAAAACGSGLTPLNCAGYQNVESNWAWFPTIKGSI